MRNTLRDRPYERHLPLSPPMPKLQQTKVAVASVDPGTTWFELIFLGTLHFLWLISCMNLYIIHVTCRLGTD